MRKSTAPHRLSLLSLIELHLSNSKSSPTSTTMKITFFCLLLLKNDNIF